MGVTEFSESAIGLAGKSRGVNVEDNGSEHHGTPPPPPTHTHTPPPALPPQREI